MAMLSANDFECDVESHNKLLMQMRNSKGPSVDPMERLFACFLGIILKY